MKKSLLAMLAIGACAGAVAQDVGRVLSSIPVMQQVSVPRQVCSNQQVEVQPQKSGAGAAMGAIAGGAAGNALGGRGAGKAAATVLGMIGGAVLGDRIEGDPEPQVRNVQQCVTQMVYENRVAGYNVVYEFAGKQYSVQMPNDPGPTIALQVSPVGATAANAPLPAPLPQTTYVPAPVVISTQQVYPVYYTRPYYPPINLELGWGYWGGHRDHGHWR